MVPPHWQCLETVWQCLKLKIYLPNDLAIQLLGFYLTEMKAHVHTKTLYESS